MCLIVLLIFGIVYAAKIPGILKQTPESFPNRNPVLFQEWRKKELGSIYVFLGATWGQSIVFFIIGIFIGLSMANDEKAFNTAIMAVSGVELLILLGGLVWAGIWGSQAAKLKRQLVVGPPMGVSAPEGAYPRYGQTVVNMPPAPQTPPIAPPAEAPPVPNPDPGPAPENPENPEPPKFEA